MDQPASDLGPTTTPPSGPTSDVDPTASPSVTDVDTKTSVADLDPTATSDLDPISSVTDGPPTSSSSVPPVNLGPTAPLSPNDANVGSTTSTTTTSSPAYLSPIATNVGPTTSAMDLGPTFTVDLNDKRITSVMDLTPTTNPEATSSESAKTMTTTTTPATASAMAPLLSDPDVLSSDPIPCPYSDSELVRKFAQLLLPALATAAVDSTTGDIFRSPASVAFDLRRDLVDQLTALSHTFIPTSLALLAADPSIDSNLLPDLDDPLDVLSFLTDNFAASRRNLLGRVTSWLLSDSREDKIDDFVQEMENHCFWTLDRRETVAAVLLKNLDYKNRYHCDDQFINEAELEAHKKECMFRPVRCKNDGCKVTYCKAQEENHDRVCMYKVLDCEQRCGEKIVRREMDRHCITVCRMKMMNCPFYQLGCQMVVFPQGKLKEHCDDYLLTHLVGVMGVKNEEGLGEEELKEKAEKMAQVFDYKTIYYIVHADDYDDLCHD